MKNSTYYILNFNCSLHYKITEFEYLYTIHGLALIKKAAKIAQLALKKRKAVLMYTQRCEMFIC